MHGSWWTAPKVRRFFREWLGYEQFATVFKDVPSSTSQFGADPSPYTISTTSYNQLQSPYYDGPAGEHEDSMIEQLDDTIARIVIEDQNVLSTLLTSSRVYVNATSHGFKATAGTQFPYNLTADVPESGRWITLPSSERAGILTHPGWLGAHGGNFEDDPSLIHRGHWIRENLLCQYIPPLSEVKVAAVVGPSAADQTARSRVETATASSACQGCHKLMNSLGTPFEIYNHAGYLRVKDHDGSNPNGSSVLVDMPDPALDGPVADGIELSQTLPQERSPLVMARFTRRQVLQASGLALAASAGTTFLRGARAGTPTKARVVLVVEGNGVYPRAFASEAAKAAINQSAAQTITNQMNFHNLYGHDTPLVVTGDPLDTPNGSLAGLALNGKSLVTRSAVVLGLSGTVAGGGHSSFQGGYRARAATRTRPLPPPSTQCWPPSWGPRRRSMPCDSASPPRSSSRICCARTAPVAPRRSRSIRPTPTKRSSRPSSEPARPRSPPAKRPSTSRGPTCWRGSPT